MLLEAHRLFQMYPKLAKTTKHLLMLTITRYRKFPEKISDDRNSARYAPETPVLPARKSDQTTFHVGRLTQDLPLPTDNKGVDELLDKWRRGHAPVYLGFTLNCEMGTVVWTLRDEQD